MKEKMHIGWKRLPATVRKPIVLLLGCMFLLASALTGWLPGPGGIPLFLIGIAILSTEYEWAQKLRDMILQWIHHAGTWLKAHPVYLKIVILVSISSVCLAVYFGYQYFFA